MFLLRVGTWKHGGLVQSHLLSKSITAVSVHQVDMCGIEVTVLLLSGADMAVYLVLVDVGVGSFAKIFAKMLLDMQPNTPGLVVIPQKPQAPPSVL